jgi:hypothetical protein
MTETIRSAAAQTRARIAALLATHTAGATVADLAEATGLSRSTVAKHLAALEAEGATHRAPGGREGNRRLPDTWAAAQAGGAAAVESAAPANPVPSVSTGDAAVNSGASGADDETAPAGTASQSSSTSGEANAPAPAGRTERPDSFSDPEAPVPSQINPVSRTRRLQPGELRLMVKAVLHDNPDLEFGPTEIGHTLRRSVGAIQNALTSMVKTGEAELTCEAPRRYRITT